MKVRSKAPLRLGIAGGGTDVSPYSDEFGGCILNATISMYAHCFLNDDIEGSKVKFNAADLGIEEVYSLSEIRDCNTNLQLHLAVYLKIVDIFNGGKLFPIEIITFSDAPPGSGLGSSSTMVVAMLEAFKQLLSLPLGEYDLAHLAFEIERLDCGLEGGKQDQYAATFGGFNFMEFHPNDRVIVNPLRIRRYIINELEASLILFFTGASRDSAKIISDQIKSLSEDKSKRLNAMHEVKKSAFTIKEKLFRADITGIAEEFKNSWIAKKKTSNSISNPLIESIELALFQSGAKSMKVSGAGGGGFIMIFVKPEDKLKIINTLQSFNGYVQNFHFTLEGAHSWTI